MNVKDYLDKAKSDGYEYLTGCTTYVEMAEWGKKFYDADYNENSSVCLVGKPFGNIMLYKVVDDDGIHDIVSEGKKILITPVGKVLVDSSFYPEFDPVYFKNPYLP
jgi:hypothetical protein